MTKLAFLVGRGGCMTNVFCAYVPFGSFVNFVMEIRQK